MFFFIYFYVFPGFMNGHAVQLFPHLVMPFTTLFGWVGSGGATFDLIKKFLKFDYLLKAVSGGSLKHSLRYLFWLTIDLQRLATICWTAGSLGS